MSGEAHSLRREILMQTDATESFRRRGTDSVDLRHFSYLGAMSRTATRVSQVFSVQVPSLSGIPPAGSGT